MKDWGIIPFFFYIFFLLFLLPLFAQLNPLCPFPLSVLFPFQTQNHLPRRRILDQTVLHFPVFCCQSLHQRKPLYITNFLTKMALRRVFYESRFSSLKPTPDLVDQELAGKHGFIFSSIFIHSVFLLLPSFPHRIVPSELFKAGQSLIVCQKNTWLIDTFQICAVNQVMPSLTEAFFWGPPTTFALPCALFYSGGKYKTSRSSGPFASTLQPSVALSTCRPGPSPMVSSWAEGSWALAKAYVGKKSRIRWTLQAS